MSRFHFGFIAICLFLLSLACPALEICSTIGGSSEWISGGFIILWGWLGAIQNQLGWFANVLFVMNLFFIMTEKRPIWLLLAAQAGLVLWAALPIPLAIDERGAGHVCGHGFGFGLWLGAHSIVIAAGLFGMAAVSQTEENESDVGIL